MMATKTPSRAPVQRAITAYHDAFVARFGFKPKISGGKDGKHFKELIATWGEVRVAALVGAFFASMDPWVLRSDYSVGAFYACAQRLALRCDGHGGIDRRTAENADAAIRATRPRKGA